MPCSRARAPARRSPLRLAWPRRAHLHRGRARAAARQRRPRRSCATRRPSSCARSDEPGRPARGDARPRGGPARGRRQGQPVLDPRLRRRPRHRRRAVFVDGVPVNMRSHAHGQGYADLHFVIPETIERVEVTKGPYDAEVGDFATAGSVNLVTRERARRVRDVDDGSTTRLPSARAPPWLMRLGGRRRRARAARARGLRHGRAVPQRRRTSGATTLFGRLGVDLGEQHAARGHARPSTTATGTPRTRSRSARSTGPASTAGTRSIRPTAATRARATALAEADPRAVASASRLEAAGLASTGTTSTSTRTSPSSSTTR